MKIRSFRLSDYISVTHLLQSVLSETCYEETRGAFARQLSWDSDLILVAELNGSVVGVIIGTIDNHNGYYYRIAVALEHQRKGIGKAMIQGLKKRFDRQNVRKIMVTVDPHNEVVLPLYESLGYRTQDFFRSFQNLSIVNG